MKTLSLKQPWAELILQGRKKIELRKWNTKFRGEFLIHASKSVDNKAMKKFDFNNLPTGKIIGKARLVEVKKYGNEDEHLKDKDLKYYIYQAQGVKYYVIVDIDLKKADVFELQNNQYVKIAETSDGSIDFDFDF